MNWYLIGILFLLSGIKLLMITPAAVIQGELPTIAIGFTSALGAWFSGTLFFFLGKQFSKIIRPKSIKAKNVSRNRKIIRLKKPFWAH